MARHVIIGAKLNLVETCSANDDATEEALKGFVKELVPGVPNFSAVVNVYRRHAPRYRELSERIAATDRLIDQIVYQLYGLTAEQIAIVEAG